MGNKITGTGTISVDGAQLESLDDGINIDMGGFKRDPKSGSGQVSGYQEKVEPPMLEVKVHHKKETSLVFFNNITNATVTAELDTGAQYIYQQSWLAEPAKIDASAGEVSLKFHAVRCDEVL